MRDIEANTARRRAAAELELAQLACQHASFGGDGEAASPELDGGGRDLQRRDAQVGIEIFEQGPIERRALRCRHLGWLAVPEIGIEHEPLEGERSLDARTLA